MSSVLGSSSSASLAQSAWSNPELLSALLPNYNISSLDEAMQSELTADEEPLTALSTQLSTTQSQVAAWQALQSDLTNLSSDAQNLASTTLYEGISASSSNTSAVQATGSGTGTPGSYLVGVSQLMVPEIDNSALQASATDALGDTGSFTINGQTVNVASSDTLQDVAGSINAAGAGVTATVLPSGGQYVLNIASTGGSAITWSDPSGILQGLGVLNGSLSPADQLQAAKPALYTINGVSEQSPTDSDSTSIPGVDLAFTALTGSTPATVSVTQSQSSIVSAFQQFATDYNQLLSDVNTYGGQGGALQGNASVLGISDTLQQILGSFNASLPNGYQSLSQIGVTVSAPVGSPSDLTMSVDTATLQQALNGNSADVALLMNGSSSGVAQQLAQQVNAMVGTDGSLQGQITALQSQETTMGDEINDPNSSINVIVNAQEQELETEFQNMLQALLTSQSQGSQITDFMDQEYGASGSSGSGI